MEIIHTEKNKAGGTDYVVDIRKQNEDGTRLKLKVVTPADGIGGVDKKPTSSGVTLILAA